MPPSWRSRGNDKRGQDYGEFDPDPHSALLGFSNGKLSLTYEPVSLRYGNNYRQFIVRMNSSRSLRLGLTNLQHGQVGCRFKVSIIHLQSLPYYNVVVHLSNMHVDILYLQLSTIHGYLYLLYLASSLFFVLSILGPLVYLAS